MWHANTLTERKINKKLVHRTTVRRSAYYLGPDYNRIDSETKNTSEKLKLLLLLKTYYLYSEMIMQQNRKIKLTVIFKRLFRL